MKNFYEAPKMELLKFQIEEVLTSASETNPWETGEEPGDYSENL